MATKGLIEKWPMSQRANVAEYPSLYTHQALMFFAVKRAIVHSNIFLKKPHAQDIACDTLTQWKKQEHLLHS